MSLKPCDIVQIRHDVLTGYAGKRGVVVSMFGDVGMWLIAFPDGMQLPYALGEFVRVAPAIGG